MSKKDKVIYNESKLKSDDDDETITIENKDDDSMSLIKKDNLPKSNKQIIYPMIDDLVETLHNDTLNNLIDSKCITELDKKTFMIFVITYFYTYLNVDKDVSKEDIKIFLSELIRNPEKRRQCIELYYKQLQLLN